MSDVLVSTEQQSAVLTFNRAAQNNSIGGALFGEIIEAVEAADADPKIRSIITTGLGKTYCVGVDAKALADLGPNGIDVGDIGADGAIGRSGMASLPYEALRVDHIGIGRWVNRFIESGTPTIAAINGPAAGGGFGLAMMHDLRVMSRTAKLHPSFGLIGLTAEMGLSWFLPRLIGSSRALRVMTRSTGIGAEEALDLGLIEAIAEPGELLEAALKLGRGFTMVHDRSVRTMKRLLRESWQSTLNDQLEREWVQQRLLLADPRMTEAIGELRTRLQGAS